MVSQSESDNYDIGLHIATAARILAVNPRNYEITPGPAPEGLDDWVTHIFSDPNLLRSLLVDQFCESQQALIWPNDRVGRRKVSINEQEIWEIQDRVNTGLISLTGESRPSPYNPQYIGPAAKVFSNKPNLYLHLISSQFFNASINLLESFMDNPDHFSTKEWPLLPLITSFPVFLNFQRTDSNKEYKVPKRDLNEYGEAVSKYTSEQDHSIHLQIHHTSLINAWMFVLGESELIGQEQFTRVQNFKRLTSLLDDDTGNFWIMCYLDFEIERTCNFGDSIDPEEWIEILGICDLFANKFGAHREEWNNDNYGVWGIGSARGSEGPIDDRFYWAWRTGYVIASGAHLLQNLDDTETKSDILKDFPSRPLALDLVASIGNNRDWESLRVLFVKGLGEIRDSDGIWDDETYNTTYYFAGPEPVIFNTSGSGSAFSWVVKIGYVDGMYARNMMVSPNPYTDQGNTRSEHPPDLLIRYTKAIESSNEIAKHFAKDAEQVQQTKTTNTKPDGEYEKDIIGMIGETLWSKINPDAQWQMLLSEKLFREKNVSNWYHYASQNWCIAAESILEKWVLPRIINFSAARQIPPKEYPFFLGEWFIFFKRYIRPVSGSGIDEWPEFDLIKGKKFEEICQGLNQCRKNAHHEVRRDIRVNVARSLVFGTYNDIENYNNSDGLLEVASALSGNN